MATTSHKNLPNSQLHECKGASTASVDQVLIAKGDGTATFKYVNPHGAVYFSNLATPKTITYPSAFTKCDPVTTASSMALQFTEATTARLTYTGTDTMDVRVLANICLDQSVGADRDIYFRVYKNGSFVGGSETAVTTQTGKKTNINLTFDIPTVATNDFIEIYLKNNGASGDVNIYSFYLTAFGMRG